MENTNFKNAGHSFTESGFCESTNNLPTYRNPPPPPKKQKNPAVIDALTGLVALHKREISGDSTITIKEWNAVIKAGETALNSHGIS